MKEIVAMLCVTSLIGFALYNGIDGAVLLSGVALVAGLGGFAAGRITKK